MISGNLTKRNINYRILIFYQNVFACLFASTKGRGDRNLLYTVDSEVTLLACHCGRKERAMVATTCYIIITDRGTNPKSAR